MYVSRTLCLSLSEIANRSSVGCRDQSALHWPRNIQRPWRTCVEPRKASNSEALSNVSSWACAVSGAILDPLPLLIVVTAYDYTPAASFGCRRRHSAMHSLSCLT
jgi:hypothetical protein